MKLLDTVALIEDMPSLNLYQLLRRTNPACLKLNLAICKAEHML